MPLTVVLVWALAEPVRGKLETILTTPALPPLGWALVTLLPAPLLVAALPGRRRAHDASNTVSKARRSKKILRITREPRPDGSSAGESTRKPTTKQRPTRPRLPITGDGWPMRTKVVAWRPLEVAMSSDVFESQLQENFKQLKTMQAIERIWQRDGALFSSDLEVARAVRNRLGWLFCASTMRSHVERLAVMAKVVERLRYDRVVVIGMGGSSLWPEVVGRHLHGRRGLPIRVADSTHPLAVADLLAWCQQGKPLFVVATKSGGTVETISLYRYFRQLFNNGDHYVAVTDADSSLEALAKAENFREIFINPSDVGGRFSAATLFGLVPAALAGVVLHDALQRIEDMLQECREPDPSLNPGAQLGAWLAAAEQTGHWQVRMALGKDLRGFGAWVEQLVAESTGKVGHGVLPVLGGVDKTHLPAAMQAGAVVGLTTFAHPDEPFLQQCQEVRATELSFVMPEPADLWAEVVRWEFATAVCGLLLGINPFDEPDVSSAKAATNALLSGQEQPAEPTRRVQVSALTQLTGELQTELEGLQPGDYLAVLAFVAPTTSNLQRLESLRQSLQEKTPAAVTVQVGPRYLHSTGQLHKGGPRQGLFVMLTDLGQPGVPETAIPGAVFGFRQLAQAQCQGDVWVLRQRGKPVVFAEWATSRAV